MMDAWSRGVETGQPIEVEHRSRGADGMYRWFLLRAQPQRDADGRIVRWYSLVTDIDDRKKAEEGVRRSEAYLTDAQHLSRTGSFGCKVSSGEMFWSEETFRIFGYDCWHVFERTGGTDHAFLERAFHKLLMNFTWWVNRKDPEGRNVFSGGFLGMDNLGVFDRSRPLPTGGQLQQADGTAWMGFYCTSMLRIALELAVHHDRTYEDVASKFLEHFVLISDSLNNLGGRGLWDDEDGFYYDQLLVDGMSTPLKLRALIGLIPLLAVQVLDEDSIRQTLPEFAKRAEWFLANRKDLIKQVAQIEIQGVEPHRRLLLSLPGRKRLERALRYLLDESEFLSPYGVRSLSRVYKDRPYVFRAGGDAREYPVAYVPGDMDTTQFGGNSNWRGPVWFPINFLLIEAVREYHRYYGDTFRIECPTGSGQLTDLNGVAQELAERLGSLFVPEEGRPRPCHGSFARYADDPHWRDYILFYEYFDGDTGRGLGASHQTGWTALVASLFDYEAQAWSSRGNG